MKDSSTFARLLDVDIDHGEEVFARQSIPREADCWCFRGFCFRSLEINTNGESVFEQ